MSISRHGITDGPHGRAIVRRAVVRGDSVYLCGVTPDPAGDIGSRTKQVLNRIDHLQPQTSTDKSKRLMVAVWLSARRRFEAHNAAWNA